MPRNPDDPIVHLESVTKDFDVGAAVSVLKGIDLTIGRGESVAIMGPSGSGKSTLLNLICGLDTPTAGSVRFAGRDLAKLGDDERTILRRQKIGMIFQTFNLLPTLNVIENVTLPLRLDGGSLATAREKATELLDRVGLISRSAHRPDELSGGERQRVAIARALIFEPELLLADEPTGNLDSHTGDDVLRILGELHDEHGMTLVLVTHNDHAAATCGRIITLLDGIVVDDIKHDLAGNAGSSGDNQ